MGASDQVRYRSTEKQHLRGTALHRLEALLRPDQPCLVLSAKQAKLTPAPAGDREIEVSISSQSSVRSFSSLSRQARSTKREVHQKFSQRPAVTSRPAISSSSQPAKGASSFYMQVTTSDCNSDSHDEGDESTASFAIRTPQEDTGVHSALLLIPNERSLILPCQPCSFRCSWHIRSERWADLYSYGSASLALSSCPGDLQMTAVMMRAMHKASSVHLAPAPLQPVLDIHQPGSYPKYCHPLQLLPALHPKA